MHRTFRTSSEDGTIALGVALGRVLRAGDVVGLDGELGAGKTRLVRGIAEGMGLDPAQVSSPTYVFVHEYRLPMGGSAGETTSLVESPLFHVDAYRLSGAQDLDSLGWDRVMGAFGVVVIEWAERLGDALKQEPSLGRVRIQAEGETERRIDLVAPAAWAQRPGWRGLAALAEDHGRTGLPPGWARCPITGKPVSPDTPTFPFADARARMADLGRWLSGSYVVSRELKEEDVERAGDADGESAP